GHAGHRRAELPGLRGEPAVAGVGCADRGRSEVPGARLVGGDHSRAGAGRRGRAAQPHRLPAAGAPMTEPLLAVSELTVRYRRGRSWDTALDSVSLEIPRGEVTAVIGESGSGKSTLAHSVVRLLPGNAVVDSGRIELAGEPLPAKSEREFRRVRGRRIGFVPQDPIASLNPTKTIGAQLRECFTLAGSALPPAAVTGRLRQDLRDVGFADPDDVMRRYPHELSGGMRQRVLVTMAFSKRPELVIA